MSRVEPAVGSHPGEPHRESTSSLLNWLRAAVLGANDGIVSVAATVMGVAAATSNGDTILIAGVAALAAGALSMAVGEYVSVSAQRDTEQALLAKERRELREDPEEELAELAGLYRRKGLSEETALAVAQELTAHDALAAHADAELGIDADDLTSPWQAAWASMLAFTVGAALPLLTITLLPPDLRSAGTVVAVAVALALAGFWSARFVGANVARAMTRVVVGGLLAMGVTSLIGSLVGAGVP